jgi:hypothetical protein
MDRKYSITTIRKKVREYGKKINAPKKLLTIRTTSDGFATPYIEINKESYNYVVSERGTEFKRKKTTDLDKILYWIFKDIVFELASEFELNHRKEDEDFRRILFVKEIELMEKLDPKWGKWLKKEQNEILKKYPYEDNA